MMIRSAITILVASFLTLASLQVRAGDGPAFPPATPESQGVSAASLRQLRDEVAGYVKNGMIVGGELLVVKNRKAILHEAFGLCDRKDKVQMARDTIFNIRSQTKPLTGMAVQILVDDGKLKFDDPVSKYLSAFDNDKSRAITIGQLLEHKSGLPLTIITKSIDQYKDLQAQAAAAGEKGPQFKPGEKFWYSDAGSDTAAAVVEKVTGMTIDRFVTDRILEPVGMVDSFYVSKSEDSRKKRLASLYFGGPGKWERIWKPTAPMYPFAWGSQSLYSTPTDYARLLAMWMDGGKVGDKQVISKEAVKRILTPKSKMTSLGTGTPYPTDFFGLTPYYGQMSMLHVAKSDKVVVIGHSGSDGTASWAFPEQDLIVCYFTQSRGGLTTIRLESTLDELFLQKERPKVPDELKPYLGTYYAKFAHYKNSPFQVVFRNGRLALDIPDQLVFELADEKDGQRAFAAFPSTSVSFKKEGDKVTSMTLLSEGGEFELPKDKPVKIEPLKKEEVAKYLGNYRREEDKVLVKVILNDGALMVEVPDTEVSVEIARTKKGWELPSNPGVTVTFQEDKSGKVVSFTVESPDGKKRVRHRVE
jgi:CubicO group peptidase (beta-lactamase class C family)